MPMMSSVPANTPGGSAWSGGGGDGDAGTLATLCAWLYDVDQYGKSGRMRSTADSPVPIPMETVAPGETLHVAVDDGQNTHKTQKQRYLWVPKAEGMAFNPVTVGLDVRTGHWTIRNSGRTNTLRVQQYGLFAAPLPPGTAMPMTGEDVAVWIPVEPRDRRLNEKGEAFRLLILNATVPPRASGSLTKLITAPTRYLTEAKQEALVAYFGLHLSWPPLPAPHVRQQLEVEEIAAENRLEKKPSPKNWARNRHDVLAGEDGLFTAADWYPRLGGAGRSLSNHLAAFHRLVELGTITLPRVRRWATSHQVEPYVITDNQRGIKA
jgi:hypothetical protein